MEVGDVLSLAYGSGSSRNISATKGLGFGMNAADAVNRRPYPSSLIQHEHDKSRWGEEMLIWWCGNLFKGIAITDCHAASPLKSRQ